LEPIVLRDEAPPEDAVVVVRGGQMDSEYVRRTAQDAHDEVGLYTVSVFLALDDSVDVVCAGEPFLARYGKVRFSTVGSLRASGFMLIPTFERPHYDVVLPDLTHSTLQRLDSCFGPPTPNPGRRSGVKP
jgi:hypothetical protein